MGKGEAKLFSHFRKSINRGRKLPISSGYALYKFASDDYIFALKIFIFEFLQSSYEIVMSLKSTITVS